MAYLVDWWADRLHFEREAREIEHRQRLISAPLLAMYNRPQNVINYQRLHDSVLTLMGVK